MSKLHVKTGDTVVLLTGDKKDRKKTGKVLEVSPKEGKVIVEGINVVKKHAKPKKAGDPSGIHVLLARAAGEFSADSSENDSTG